MPGRLAMTEPDVARLLEQYRSGSLPLFSGELDTLVEWALDRIAALEKSEQGLGRDLASCNLERLVALDRIEALEKAAMARFGLFKP